MESLNGHYFGMFYFLRTTVYSTLLHLPPLRFYCVDGLESSPGPLQRVHWQSDALTTTLDLIQTVSKESLN
jgi:hypothetical protein